MSYWSRCTIYINCRKLHLGVILSLIASNFQDLADMMSTESIRVLNGPWDQSLKKMFSKRQRSWKILGQVDINSLKISTLKEDTPAPNSEVQVLKYGIQKLLNASINLVQMRLELVRINLWTIFRMEENTYYQSTKEMVKESSPYLSEIRLWISQRNKQKVIII